MLWKLLPENCNICYIARCGLVKMVLCGVPARYFLFGRGAKDIGIYHFKPLYRNQTSFLKDKKRVIGRMQDTWQPVFLYIFCGVEYDDVLAGRANHQGAVRVATSIYASPKRVPEAHFFPYTRSPWRNSAATGFCSLRWCSTCCTCTPSFRCTFYRLLCMVCASIGLRPKRLLRSGWCCLLVC